MKSQLELWIAVPTTIVVSLLLVITIVAEVLLEQKQSEETLREQAYILSQEMKATWDFVSVNQDRINTDGDGTFTFKGLHCSIAGTSISALFTHRTDYVIRYVSDHPRNASNSPDDFESAAIAYFRSQPNVKDYSKTAALEERGDYYRYAVPLVMESGCMECHGDPKGEIDVTGFPKEGMQKGALVGIASISIPLDTYQEGMMTRIIQRAVLSAAMLAGCLLTIIIVTRRFVIHPLKAVEGAVQKIGSGDLEAKIKTERINPKGELLSLSEQFNDMADELNALHKDLENMVTIRTEQLADANQILADQAHELESMNERLKENDLYKSHFFTMMSHELRTPITAIRAYIDMLVDTEGIDEEQREAATGAIRANILSLSKLVDSILESARMEVGAVKIEKAVVDASDIMNELAKTLEPLASDKGITLHIFNDDTPLFMADEDKLLHILENLGSNAVKYTDKGGTVSVEAYLSPDGKEMCFDVSDDGIGIAQEEQEIVFQKFVQGGNSVSRPVSGSGLGLALAKEYAELHGGRILLKSELGKGSLFTVCIPFQEPNFSLD